jgi:hypothetical protein
MLLHCSSAAQEQDVVAEALTQQPPVLPASGAGECCAVVHKAGVRSQQLLGSSSYVDLLLQVLLKQLL